MTLKPGDNLKTCDCNLTLWRDAEMTVDNEGPNVEACSLAFIVAVKDVKTQFDAFSSVLVLCCGVLGWLPYNYLRGLQ